jgi:protein-S-isoprenylcysteine O-methyltransferase Ste14
MTSVPTPVFYVLLALSGVGALMVLMMLLGLVLLGWAMLELDAEERRQRRLRKKLSRIDRQYRAGKPPLLNT